MPNTYKTDTLDAQVSPSAAKRVDGSKTSGRIAFLDATYKTGGGEAAGDTIDVGELPIGAVLLPDLCRISTDGVGGTSATVAALGDATDDDRYSASSHALTAAGSNPVSPVAALMASPWVITDATKVIKAKLGLGSGSFTSGKIVRFRLAYLMP